MGTTGKQNTLDCNSMLWSLFFLSVCIERLLGYIYGCVCVTQNFLSGENKRNTRRAKDTGKVSTG